MNSYQHIKIWTLATIVSLLIFLSAVFLSFQQQDKHQVQQQHSLSLMQEFHQLSTLSYQINLTPNNDQLQAQWAQAKQTLLAQLNQLSDTNQQLIIDAIHQQLVLLQSRQPAQLLHSVKQLQPQINSLLNKIELHTQHTQQDTRLILWLLGFFSLLGFAMLIGTLWRKQIQPMHQLSQSIPDKELICAITPKEYPNDLRNIVLYIQQINQTIAHNHNLQEKLQQQVDIAHNARKELNEAIMELKSNQEQLMRMEKFSALGVLIGGVAHELNNPLMGVQNYIEYLQKLQSDAKGQKILGRAHEEILRMQKLVQNMLIFSRENQHDENSTLDLIEIINSVVNFMQAELERYNIELSFKYPENEQTWVYAKEDALKQVLINLLSNARDAAKESERPMIRITVEKTNTHKTVCTIMNNGHPIPEKVRVKIFDPFFTTKAVGHGTGLGLSISQELIQKMNGELQLKQSSHEGTIFSFKLRSQE